MGEEKRVVIDVEGQGQAAGGEGAGKKVEMSQETLARVEPSEGEEAAVVVEEFEQGRLVGLVPKPTMWRSIRTARAGRSVGPASGAPVWDVFCERYRVRGCAGVPSGGWWRDRA